MKKLLFLLLPLFAFTCSRVAVGTVSSVYLDSTNTNIVSNDLVSENLLSKYTGFTTNNATSKYTINIKGDTSNSFSIISKNDTINISGNAIAAVTYFLDKYVGVRFYMPTDLWASQRKDSILIDSNISVTHIPFTPVIFSTGYKTSNELDWAKENNIYNYTFGATSHTMSARFFDSSMFVPFHDIYDNGFPKNSNDQNFEPNFTKSDIVAASMYSSRKFFAANSTLNYISFGVMDSNNGYPSPKAGETLSQTFTKYINALADSFKVVFPGKFITYTVYGKVNQWPIPYLLRTNVIPISVIHFANAILDNVIDSNGSKVVAKTTPQMGNHDWAQGGGFIVPRIYSKFIQSIFKNDILTTGIKFQFAHLEMYPNWSLDGMKYYEMAKIYDDPTIDIDSIRLLFCRDMFGDAASQMKNYFNNLEALSSSMNNNPLIKRSIGFYPSQMQLTVQDSTLAANARVLINNALALTSGVEHERVQFFSNGFTISEGLWKIYNEKPEVTFISSYENFLRDSINGNQMYLNTATSPTFLNDMNNLIKSDKVK